VRDGVYVENIIINKQLTIKSENGFENCIIQSASPEQNAVTITADRVNLSGFTLREAGICELLCAGISINADNCSITDNKLSDNKAGILLDHAANNLIKNNSITDNYYAISLYSSENNLIYLNNFINTNNVYSYESTNLWNSTDKITYLYNGLNFTNYLGNYWSDYTGLDNNSDGIGDTSYSVDSDKDYYPLMQPFENYFKAKKPYAITIHFHYPMDWHAGDELPAGDITMIQKARDLNAYYIRFDVWWDEVEPEEDVFNENAIAYFKAVVNEIESQGMEPLVILGTGIPDWAKRMMIWPFFKLYLVKGENLKEVIEIPRNKELKIVRMNIETVRKIENKDLVMLTIPENAEIEEIPTGKVEAEKVIEFAKRNRIPLRDLKIEDGYAWINMFVSKKFLKEAKEYAEKLAYEIGGDVYYYQLGNEPNHALDLIYWLDGPKYIKALYVGINTSDNELETAVNFFVDPPHDSPGPWLWTNSVISYLNSVGDCINIVGIDHYPGTWSLEPYDSWYQIGVLLNIIENYGKKAAVMETGFSTWEPFRHSEQDQQEFINTAFPAIRDEIQTIEKDLVFVGWYELTDEEKPTIPWLLPEKHFGILHLDLTPKLGYNDLRQQFSQ
jgi:parallel beta-helix repeat protein